MTEFTVFHLRNESLTEQIDLRNENVAEHNLK